MKKFLKHWGVLILAIALVAVVGKYTLDNHLKATDTEGTHTAESELSEGMEAQATVDVVIPSGEEAVEEEVEPESTAVPNITLEAYINNDGPIYYGDVVYLGASVDGSEYLSNYDITWQYNDGAGWNDIENVHGSSYSFVLNEENGSYAYRATMSYDFK